MIAIASILLAAWEAFAIATKKPTVTTLSARRGTGPLVWAWLAALAAHFYLESRKH